MKLTLSAPALLAVAFAMQATPGIAQTDLTMLGGATGATVYCIQAGELNNGLFVGTFFQTGVGAWEEHSKGGTFKFQEKKRDELVVEMFDPSRKLWNQFDFVSKTMRHSSVGAANWKEYWVILSAVDKAGSKECIAGASRPGAPGGPPLPPGAAATGSLTFVARSHYHLKLAIAFYSTTRNVRWPGTDTPEGRKAGFFTMDKPNEHLYRYKLSCSTGETICYGAWRIDNGGRDIGGKHWGVGHTKNNGCRKCCFQCGQADAHIGTFVP
jgi:hypothetical protein